MIAAVKLGSTGAVDDALKMLCIVSSFLVWTLIGVYINHRYAR